MIASPPPALVQASGTRRRAFDFVSALSALGFLCLTALALPTARAQTAPTDDAASISAPTTVLHLRAADALPTFAALHARLLNRLKVRGEVTAPKSDEPHVIQFRRKTTGHVLTAAERDDARTKYAAAHPISLAQKQAIETMKTSDSATLMKVAKKGQIDPGIYKVILSQIVSQLQPLQASLSPNQPREPSGRAYLTFVSPKSYDKTKNVMSFQNDYFPYSVTGNGQETTYTMPDITSPSGKSSTFTMPSLSMSFTPSSYLQLEMKAKAGSMYLVAVKASWGTAKSSIDTYDGLLVFCGDSGLSGIADTGKPNALDDNGSMKTIPGGVFDTPMVVLCDRDGWYDITIAGITNPWDFRGVSIKEISAD